jgi:hypothetical protein
MALPLATFRYGANKQRDTGRNIRDLLDMLLCLMVLFYLRQKNTAPSALSQSEIVAPHFT